MEPSFDRAALGRAVAYAGVSALSAALRFDGQALPVVYGAVAPVLSSPAVAVLCASLAPRLFRKLGRGRAVALCALLVGLSVVPRAVAVPTRYAATAATAAASLNALAGVILLALPSAVARDVLPDAWRLRTPNLDLWRTVLVSLLLAARSLGAYIGAAFDVAWPVAVALAGAALVAVALPALIKPAPPPTADEEAFAERLVVPPSPVVTAPRGFLPLAVQRTYLLLALGFALVAGGAAGRGGALGRAPTAAYAAALQLVAGLVAGLDRERGVVGACAALAAICAVLAALPTKFGAWASFAASVAAPAPVGAVYELVARRLPPDLVATAGAGLVFCANLVALGVALLKDATPGAWPRAACVLAGAACLAVELVAVQDWPLFDLRPRHASDEYRIADSAVPSFAASLAPPPPPPPRRAKCRPQPCPRGSV
jgi:hypothetical protein